MDAGRRPAGRHAERQEQRAGNDAIGHAKGAVDHLGAETDENERQDFAEMGDKDVDHSLVPAMIVYRLDWYITGRQETFCFIGRSRNSPPSRSEEHTSELQSLMRSSYTVLCLNTKKTTTHT